MLYIKCILNVYVRGVCVYLPFVTTCLINECVNIKYVHVFLLYIEKMVPTDEKSTENCCRKWQRLGCINLSIGGSPQKAKCFESKEMWFKCQVVV